MRDTNRIIWLTTVAVASFALAGCGGDGEQTSQSTGPQSESRRPVPATANIFGAGHEAPPEPGGGGAGILPPVWRLPPGSDRVVTFPYVAGQLNCCVGHSDTFYGAIGDPIPEEDVRTDVSSFGGISGIVHEDRGLFLTGVFLDDAEPTDPAPPRLDFTNRDRFRTLSPKLAQTFYIGDGKDRRYRVPRGATRLYLGFADAFLYEGRPGWYDNNAGRLMVTVDVVTEEE